MKKILLPLPFLIMLCQATAQKDAFFEAGFLFGLTNYSGDLSDWPVEIGETHLGYGIFARYFFSKNIAAKMHVYSGSISGDDANSAKLSARRLRFSTNIVEMGAVFEWYPFSKERLSFTGEQNFQITPYIYAGIGASFTNADAQYYGNPEDADKNLRVALPEENLNDKFLLVPIGGGIRADILERLSIGVEGGIRPVFSDDIDGIRYNGNPKYGDWYYFGGVTVSFLLGSPKKR